MKQKKELRKESVPVFFQKKKNKVGYIELSYETYSYRIKRKERKQ